MGPSCPPPLIPICARTFEIVGHRATLLLDLCLRGAHWTPSPGFLPLTPAPWGYDPESRRAE